MGACPAIAAAVVAIFAGFLLWTPTPLPDAQWSDTPHEWPPALQYFDAVASADLTVQCYSVGEPSAGKGTIVFAHGFPETAASWRDYVLHYGARGYHAVACDLRNVNASVSTTSHYAFTMDQLADDMRGIVDATTGQHSRVVVVGHDWGAAAVQAFAIKYPSRVSALVSLAVPHVELYRWYNTLRLPVVLQHVWYFLLFGLTGPVARWKAARDDWGWFVWFLHGSSLPGSFSKADLGILKEVYGRRMDAGVGSTMTTWYTMGNKWLLLGLQPPGLTSQLMGSMFSPWSTIAAPALQVFGAQDIYVTASAMVEAHPDQSAFFSHPKSRHMTYPDATHWLNHEKKSDLIREIDAFLDDVL